MAWGSVISAVAPAVIGGLFGDKGASRANEANLQIARENNQTQIELANTAMQRRVADLKAAGLNPMLAYTQGGASVPQLQQARVENTASSAIAGASAAMSNQLLKAQIATQESQTALNSANAAKAVADTRSSLADAAIKEINANAAKVADASGPGYAATEVTRLTAQNARNMYESLKANNDWNSVMYLNDLAARYNFRNFDEAVADTDFRRRLEETAQSKISTGLLGLKVPEASAMAGMWGSQYGKTVAPYVNSAGGIVRGVTSLKK